MHPTITRWYWLLGLAQAAHSAEEIAWNLPSVAGRVPESLAPVAHALAGVLQTPERFAIANLILVTAMLATVPWIALAASPGRRRVLWAAAIIEIANGLMHLVGSVALGTYVPGAVTAVLLLACACGLGRQLWASASRPPEIAVR